MVTEKHQSKKKILKLKSSHTETRRKIDYHLLTEDISNIIMEGEDLDELIKRSDDSLRSILKKHAPEKTKQITLTKKKL